MIITTGMLSSVAVCVLPIFRGVLNVWRILIIHPPQQNTQNDSSLHICQRHTSSSVYPVITSVSSLYNGNYCCRHLKLYYLQWSLNVIFVVVVAVVFCCCTSAMFSIMAKNTFCQKRVATFWQPHCKRSQCAIRFDCLLARNVRDIRRKSQKISKSDGGASCYNDSHRQPVHSRGTCMALVSKKNAVS